MMLQQMNPRIRLLEPEEYERIVKEGRAAEVLANYVKRKGGRPAVAGEPKSNAERQREWRERQRQNRETAATARDK